MLVLGCLSKEDVALTFGAMGVYAAVVQRRGRGSGSAWSRSPAPGSRSRSARRAGDRGPALPLLGLPDARPELDARAPRLRPAAVADLGAVSTARRSAARWQRPSAPGSSCPSFRRCCWSRCRRSPSGSWRRTRAFWSTGSSTRCPLAPILAFAAVDSLSRLRRVRFGGAAAMLVCGLVLTVAVVRPLRGLVRLHARRPRCRDRRVVSTGSRRSATVAASGRADPAPDAPAPDRSPLPPGARPVPRDRRPAPVASGYRAVCSAGGVTVLRARA